MCWINGWVDDRTGTVLIASALDNLVKSWEALLSEGRPDLFDLVESALVHSAYAQAHENQVRTARMMGITRNMLRTLLKRHGLLGDAAGEPQVSATPRVAA